jgi:hypothetical protein
MKFTLKTTISHQKTQKKTAAPTGAAASLPPNHFQPAGFSGKLFLTALSLPALQPASQVRLRCPRSART